jgi:hypothetical protein
MVARRREIIDPFEVEQASALRCGNFSCVVRGTGVNDNNLVDLAVQGVEAIAQEGRLVSHNKCSRDPRNRNSPSAEAGLSGCRTVGDRRQSLADVESFVHWERRNYRNGKSGCQQSLHRSATGYWDFAKEIVNTLVRHSTPSASHLF